MLGIDPTVLMIVLLLIGLGAAMVFIGQMKSRVDKIEAGLVRQSQLFSKFVADTAVMFSGGPQVQAGGPAPEALMTAREVASPTSVGQAGAQFTMENPRDRIPVPDREPSSSEEYESDDSDDDDEDSEADDLSSEGSETEVEEVNGEVEGIQSVDTLETVDLSEPVSTYEGPSDSAVKVVSLEPGEHSQAAISISQMYNLTMMGGPVQVADNEDVRVEELDASSLGEDEESLASVNVNEDDEGAADEEGEKDGDEDTAVMKKMKVADLRSLVVSMNLTTAADASRMKKPELVKLIEDNK